VDVSPANLFKSHDPSSANFMPPINSVTRQRQLLALAGTQPAGNAIDFFVRVLGLSFHDALRQITGT
jgi:hypothetical protein